jgi:hypothetical protein
MNDWEEGAAMFFVVLDWGRSLIGDRTACRAWFSRLCIFAKKMPRYY